MKIAFTKKHFIAIGLIILLIIGCAFLVRYVYIAPEIQAKKQSETTLEMEREQVQILNQRLRGGNTTISETSFDLQRKVPVQALLDQFLLDISRAEALSDSLVLYMDIEDEEINSIEDLMHSSEDEGQAEEGESNEDEEVTEELEIEGLRKITATVFLQALNYESLASFLHEIDRLPRIINIDSIYIHDPTGELYEFGQNISQLQFEVKISTYYQPTLDELKGDNPTFDFNRPGNKDNPLYDN